MPIDSTKKEINIQNSLNSPMSTNTITNIVLNSWMTGFNTNNVKDSICNINSLSSSNANTFPIGQIVFSKDLFVPIVAGNTSWLGLDGRPITCNATQNILYTWGCNCCGNLGDGTTTNKCVPVTTIGGGTNWKVIGGSAGIKTDGTLWTWGRNDFGILGDGPTTHRSSPGTTAGGGTTWCQISKWCTSVGLKTDGTLWTWGYNGYGQLGDGTTTHRSSPGTTAGGGTTWCFVTNLGNMIGIKTDGTLWTWGAQRSGQLGNGSFSGGGITSPVTTCGGGTNWCTASMGATHVAGIKTDGTLWLWGTNNSGQLGDGTAIGRACPGTTAGGGTTWCQVSLSKRSNLGSGQATAAIKMDGTLWTWGYNVVASCGILGDGLGVGRNSPGTTAGGGTTWCKVSMLSTTASALKTDGTLWTWGRDSAGELGSGGYNFTRLSPVTIIGGGNDWCQLEGFAIKSVIPISKK